MAKEERDKREAIRVKVLEQKILRDKQIEEHNRVKNAAKKEKRADYERILTMQQEVQEQKEKERLRIEETKKRVMSTYKEQMVGGHRDPIADIKLQATSTYHPGLTNENMLDSLFQEKRNISKEMMAQNEKRIEIIKERMQTVTDTQRARDFVSKTEQLREEQLRQEQLKEDLKRKERKAQELETKAFLDQQIAAKLQKKESEKMSEQRHAQNIHADVVAFERSKKDVKREHDKVHHAHREELVKQIGEHKTLKGKAVMAPQEYAINKQIIDEVVGGSPQQAVKRPF